MKRLALVLSLVVALLVVPAAQSHAWSGGGGGSHGGGAWHGGGWHGGGWHGGGWYGGGWHGGGWHAAVFVGGPWWWGWYPYAYPYPYYYPALYAAYPPVVVDQGPSVYIQQPVARGEASAPAYWYYCPSSKAYYPTVQKCRVAWIKVPPTPQ